MYRASGFIFLAILAVVAASHTHEVRYDPKTRRVTMSADPKDGAVALNVYYKDTMEQNGYAALRIQRSASGPLGPRDTDLWYAAGYAEGNVTQLRIFQVITNNIAYLQPPPKVVQFLQQQMSYMEAQVSRYGAADTYWGHVGLVLAQLRGIADGYNAVAPPTQALDYATFLYYMTNADWFELNIYYTNSTPMLFSAGMYRLADDDLYVAHGTIFGYTGLMPIYKDYDFGTTRVMFPSYPASLISYNDFYVTSNNITIQTASLPVYNPSVYQTVQANGVSSWIRLIVANQLAVDGASWASTYCRDNNGLYSSQYTILNANLYQRGMRAADVPDGVLWLVEQLPGMCPYQDVTPVLRSQGYFGGYNLAYFTETYVMSGAQAMYEKYGDYFSYTRTPRAQILARDAPKAQSLDDMKRLIRYNQWQTDPLSQCSGCNPSSNPVLSTSMRYDLVPSNGTWGALAPYLSPPSIWGTIDGKVTSATLVLDGLTVDMISGPTCEDQAPFQWSTSPVVKAMNPPPSILGLPDLYQFPWVRSTSLFS